MSNGNGEQCNRLSIPDNDRQRVEIACFNAHKLEEVNSSKYPNLTKVLDARGGTKRARLRQILEYLTNENEKSFYLDNDPERKAYTDIPIKELIGKYGGAPTTYTSLFNLLAVCGMVEKHNANLLDEDHATWLDDEARQHAARERGRRKIRRAFYYSARVYYHFPMWTDEVLERAETLASNRTGTLTQVIDVYGVDQAQVALDTTRGIPQDTERARE